MKKFLALYMAPVGFYQEKMKDMSPEEMQKSLDGWNAWMADHQKDFVDGGAPVGKNKRVTMSGVTNAHNEVTGYSILQAETHEAAAAIAATSPHLMYPEVYVDVVEIVDMKQ